MLWYFVRCLQGDGPHQIMFAVMRSSDDIDWPVHFSFYTLWLCSLINKLTGYRL